MHFFRTFFFVAVFGASFEWAALAQGALSSGANSAGSISGAGEIDEWTFEAGRGDSIALSIGEVFEDEIDPGFVPWIRLESPDGELLGNNWATEVAQLNVTAPLTGSYKVLVGSNDGGNDALGDYLLHFVLIPGDSVIPEGDHGGTLSSGANHPGAIHLGDLDVWWFDAQKDDAIALSIGEVLESEVDPGFVPWIRLYGPDGTLLRNNWGTDVAQLFHKAPLSGSYKVLVGSNDGGNDSLGDYLLHFLLIPGTSVVPEGDHGGSLTNGLNHGGAIHLGDLDVWWFDAQKDDSIALSIGEIFTSEVDPGFVPWIQLYGPDGALLGNNWGTDVAQLFRKAPLSGSYKVMVGSNDGGNDSLGDYLLHFVLVPGTVLVAEGDHGGALTNGGNHPGAIDLGDLDVWWFDAVKDDSIALSIGEVFESEIDPGFVPWIQLYGPDGALLGNNWGTDVAQLFQKAPLSGSYKVLVGSNDGGNDSLGDYLLHFIAVPGTAMVPAGDDGGALTNGGNHAGAIHLADLDVWWFDAEKDDSIALSIGEVLESEIDPGFVPWIQLYGPDGALLGNNWGPWVAQINYTAPLTGTYKVLVGSNDGGNDSKGEYVIHQVLMPEHFIVSAQDDGGHVAASGQEEGEIELGDLDIWTFGAHAGSRAQLRVRKMSGDLVPWVRIYSTRGSLMQNTWDATEVELGLDLPESGLYAIVIGSNDGGNDADGTYSVELTGIPMEPVELRYMHLLPNNSLFLTWPSELVDFVLQSNTALQAEGWEDVELEPESNGLNTTVIIPIEEGNRFYRSRPRAEVGAASE